MTDSVRLRAFAAPNDERLAMLLDMANMPLWVVGAVFVGAAALVWAAGTRISRYADAIAAHTGLGRAFLGLLLLGGITSLPEVATSSTAAYSGDPALAVNNLLGGLAMQVAILAIADAAIGRDALTSIVVEPVVLLLGMLGILMLSVVSIATVVGDVSLLGVGAWTSLIVLIYFAGIWLAATYPSRSTWAAADASRGEARQQEEENGERDGEEDRPSLRSLIIKTCIAGALILIAGFVLTRAAEGVAHQTGLGSSFVGAVFLAISTSLPEVSTVLSAVKLRRYEMAVSDILGTNLFDAGLIFLVDAVYSGPPVLNEVGRFSSVAALLGVVVTAIFMVGLIERRDRTFLRMGYDSLAVLIAYAGGLVVLYTLR